jgi:hypothetical protein
VGGVLEQVVVFGLLAGDDVLGLPSNLNHGRTEPGCELIKQPFFLRNTYLSISSRVSDSVGSISMQVEMGQEHVGGWNP